MKAVTSISRGIGREIGHGRATVFWDKICPDLPANGGDPGLVALQCVHVYAVLYDEGGDGDKGQDQHVQDEQLLAAGGGRVDPAAAEAPYGVPHEVQPARHLLLLPLHHLLLLPPEEQGGGGGGAEPYLEGRPPSGHFTTITSSSRLHAGYWPWTTDPQ